MITIYHNPRCSKSRAALELVQKIASEKDLPLEVVDYLLTPLSFEQLVALQRQLEAPAREMVRDSESEFDALGLEQADDTSLLRALCTHPTLLQRPIVTYKGRAMIGRPPEGLNALFS